MEAQRKKDTAALSKAADEDDKDRVALEAEKAKKDKLAAERLKNQDYILQQIREKKETRSTERERKKQQRRAVESEAKQFAAADQKRVDGQRLHRAEHRAELERQIALRMPMGPQKEVMSECELMMNKRLLLRVTKALSSGASGVPSEPGTGAITAS